MQDKGLNRRQGPWPGSLSPGVPEVGRGHRRAGAAAQVHLELEPSEVPASLPRNLSQLSHRNNTQERQGGGSERNLPVQSPLFSKCLAPPLCLSCQMTQLPSNSLPKNTPKCVTGQYVKSYRVTYIYQGTPMLACTHL